MRAVTLLALLAACGEPEPELTACEGAGDPSLALGDGGQLAFEPWSDGDPVEVRQQGVWGFQVEAQVSGIDVTDAVTVLVRYALDGASETTDVAATVTFQCEGEGPAWAGVFARLPDEVQGDDAARAALDGVSLDLSVSASDPAGEAASDEGTFELVIP